jgi:hypothetical protein
MSKNRLRDIHSIHGEVLTDAFGAVNPRDVQRNLDESVAFQGRRPTPIVSGRWDDGSAQRRLMQVLVDLGIVQDETEKGDVTEAGGFGAVPTVTKLTAAGTTGTVTITGNDTQGEINIVPGGTGIAAGSLLTLTFAVERPSAKYNVHISMNSQSARSLASGIGPTSRATTGFDIDCRAVLTSGTTYTWGYSIFEWEY